MENQNKKNSKGIIILLIVIIFIILLFVTGIISFEIVEEKNLNVEVSDKVKNDISNFLTGTTNSLNPLKDCYANALSDNNYKENAKNFIAMRITYTNRSDVISEPYNLSNCSDKCQELLSKDGNVLLNKETVDKLMKMYNLNDINKYFTPLPGYENEYFVLEISDEINNWKCNYKIDHDMEFKYIAKNTIQVIDKQIVKEYDNIQYTDVPQGIIYGNELKSTNRTVTYTIEENNNLYILKDVLVG